MPTPASLRRRLACALYEGLSLFALVFLLAFPMAGLTQALPHAVVRPFWQAFVFIVPGLYLTWCWRRGQTLAMRTWGIRIESASGGRLSLKQAWLRYLLAWLVVPALGLGWWAALLRRDRQFLHDHLAGTRLVRAEALSAVPATTPSSTPPG